MSFVLFFLQEFHPLKTQVVCHFHSQSLLARAGIIEGLLMLCVLIASRLLLFQTGR
jgi:hypothetical protein